MIKVLDYMIKNLYFSFLNKLEKKIFNQKRRFVEKQNRLFLKKYSLKDEQLQKSFGNYNGYQATPINLCKCLTDSGIINKNESIIDVGCGSGIFLCYLLSKGYLNVSGIEINNNIYATAIDNIEKVVQKECLNLNVNILCKDFFELKEIEAYNVFYVFNSFNSEETYCEFFKKIFDSVCSNKRKIKIIFLYLNAIGKKTLNKQNWLTRTKVICDDSQFCNMCIKFTIYENKI